MPSSFKFSDYYSITDVAELLGVKPKNARSQFYILNKQDEMPAHHLAYSEIGTIRVYLKTEIDAWLKVTRYRPREYRHKPLVKSVERILEEREIAALERGEQTELKVPYKSWSVPYSTHGTFNNSGRDFEQDDLEASKLD